jgi:hypothetical protein
MIADCSFIFVIYLVDAGIGCEIARARGEGFEAASGRVAVSGYFSIGSDVVTSMQELKSAVVSRWCLTDTFSLLLDLDNLHFI